MISCVCVQNVITYAHMQETHTHTRRIEEPKRFASPVSHGLAHWIPLVNSNSQLQWLGPRVTLQILQVLENDMAQLQLLLAALA